MESQRKNSKKRQAILSALCADKRHPSAEMLYNTLKPSYPELSLGTVYRNLALLVEDGQAVTVCHVAGKERYDGRTDAHGHFVCRRCRRIFDLELPETIGETCRELCEGIECAAESCSVCVEGLCGECREK